MGTSRASAVTVLCLAVLGGTSGNAAERPLEIAITVAPKASYSTIGGYDLGVTAGLAVGWRFSERWSVEIRGLRSRGDRIDLDSVQLGARRFFDLGGAWWPFVHGGLYRERTETDDLVVCVQAIQFPCPRRRTSDENDGLFAGAGVDWRFTARAALRIDGLVMAADTERYGTETWQSAGVGLAFRF